MADRFQASPCTVVVSNNFDTHGTITRASVAHLTPAQLETLFKPGGLFADMDAWFQTSFEMKACGTKVNGMYDWVMSSYKSVGSLLNVTKLDKGPSLLHPFILGRQDSVINKEFWAVVGGCAQSAYTGDTPAGDIGTATVGPLTTAHLALGSATDRIVRVVSRYGLDMDAKWFLDRDRVAIFGLTGGQSTQGNFKVLACDVATDLTYVDVLLVSENAGSSTVFNSAPTAGVLLALGNNVSDYESWCQNRPTVDPRKRVPFWYQTFRRARSVDAEYMKVFKRLMESSQYFREFGDLPLAERNRQDEEKFQRDWLNAFFFGKAISANQTLALWQSLDAINTTAGTQIDSGQGGKIIGRRANMIGIREQMLACSRVRNLQNNPLRLTELFAELYNLVRARKSQGKTVTEVDFFTDSEYAAFFEAGMIDYYKAIYTDLLRIQIDEGSNELGFAWRKFKVNYPIGVKINIVTHEFFDDFASAFNTESMGSAGTFMLALEIGKPGPQGGTIYPGVIASNRKMRRLGELEPLARLDPTMACVMEATTEDITLVSETTTAICECPANSIWLENIARIKPVATAKTTPYTDMY